MYSVNLCKITTKGPCSSNGLAKSICDKQTKFQINKAEEKFNELITYYSSVCKKEFPPTYKPVKQQKVNVKCWW